MNAEGNWEVVRNNFSTLKQILQARGIESVNGILADLGVSSVQLDQQERGFSYQQDGPLDMRMDKTGGETAAQWLSRVTQSELQRVLSEYGEERYAGRISQAIIRARITLQFQRLRNWQKLLLEACPPLPGVKSSTRLAGAFRPSGLLSIMSWQSWSSY